jgi:hypothetical protein
MSKKPFGPVNELK